jgi:hypothetical protein
VAHPATGEPLELVAPLPQDLEQMLEFLRQLRPKKRVKSEK